MFTARYGPSRHIRQIFAFFTTEARVRSKDTLCEICGGKCGSETVLSANTSFFLCQHYYPNATGDTRPIPRGSVDTFLPGC